MFNFIKRWPLNLAAIVSLVVSQSILFSVTIDALTTPKWQASLIQQAININIVLVGAVVGYWISRGLLQTVRATSDRAQYERIRWLGVVGLALAYSWLF